METKTLINNDFYDDLHEDWYTASNHPIALLRSENQLRNPWIAEEITKRFNKKVSILDVGCGAGLLTNALAKMGHRVSGIDLSEHSLKIAKQKDSTRQVTYVHGNAYELPFPDESFDVVSAMDILEHVETPQQLIYESSRVLKKNGIFFFHTFNRNLISYLVIIKGVDWFVQNAPKNMHVYPLFIKPRELKKLCSDHSLSIDCMLGFRPRLSPSFFKMLFTQKVPADFSFRFSKSLMTGYCGIATKE